MIDREIGTDGTTSEQLEILIHAADAGATYMSWIVMREPFTQHAEALPDNLAGLVARLNGSLISMSDEVGSSSADAPTQHQMPAGKAEPSSGTVEHALTNGELADPSKERHLSEELSRAILPQRLRTMIRELHGQGVPFRLRITPSPRLSRVPWELLNVETDDFSIDGDRKRLIEIAEIVIDPPVTVHADRARLPRRWQEVSRFPAVHIIDPQLPESARTSGLLPTLPERGELLRKVQRDMTSLRSGGLPCLRMPLSRRELSRQLREHKDLSRLFYFGHISSLTSEPGSAALHLSDEYWSGPNPNADLKEVWGWSKSMNSRGQESDPQNRAGAKAQPGDHLPFCALDLLLGTLTQPDAGIHSLYGFDEPTAGSVLWPMPPRVALIACEGGVDFRSTETFGLVIAIIDSGAELVTTTRWPLPTDFAVAHYLSVDTPTARATRTGPATELALAVDQAHRQEDAISALRQWQLSRLENWRQNGDIRNSPLFWASLMTTHAPARKDAVKPLTRSTAADESTTR